VGRSALAHLHPDIGQVCNNGIKGQQAEPQPA
jgi:hypothetical protein